MPLIYGRMTNSEDPDEPSHLDLHCLQNDLFWSSELKGLKFISPG